MAEVKAAPKPKAAPKAVAKPKVQKKPESGGSLQPLLMGNANTSIRNTPGLWQSSVQTKPDTRNSSGVHLQNKETDTKPGKTPAPSSPSGKAQSPTQPLTGNSSQASNTGSKASGSQPKTKKAVHDPDPHSFEPDAKAEKDLQKDNPIAQRAAGYKEEEIAQVKALGLEGNSEQSMESFTTASASQVAMTYPDMGDAINQKLGSEKQEAANDAPTLTAGTTGVKDPNLKPVNQPGNGKNAQLKDGVTEPEPPKAKIDPFKAGAKTTLYKEDEKKKEKLKNAPKKESGGFFNWLFGMFADLLGDVKTKDENLNTSAGQAPELDTSGKANPQRTDHQVKEGKEQVGAEKKATANEIVKNPGQQNVQPLFFEVPNEVIINAQLQSKATTASDSGMADFAHLPLPESVRTQADLDLDVKMEKSLSKPREETRLAAQKRDSEKQGAIKEKQAEAEKLNKQAEKEQQDTVDQNRQAIAKEQERGIQETVNQMTAFTTEADKKKQKAHEEVNSRIKEDKGAADKKLRDAEKDAEKKKVQAEKDADTEKKKAEKDSENKSWWGKFKDAVSSAVSWVTEQIGKIFDAVRKAITDLIDAAKEAALALIEAGRKWIIEKLDQFGDWLKEQANKYLKNFPELRKKVIGFIDDTVEGAKHAVNQIADGLKKGVEALASALTKALNAILDAFEAALTSAIQIAGALLKGDFAEALKIAFMATCKIAGINPQPILDFINKAGETIGLIFKDPAGFFSNVAGGVSLGINQFVKNIKKHLISGLIGWLTGAMSDVPIQMPAKFDLKGIFSLVTQILGLTYDRIRAKVVKRIGPKGEQIVGGMEKTFQFVKDLITKGPIVIYERIKDKFNEIKQMAMEKIRNLVIFEVVKSGIKWLLSLLNPASAIVKAVLMLYDFVMFMIERKDQIIGFVMAVFDTVGPLARGQLKKAGNAVEGAMGRGVPVILGLLANLLGLGGIGKSVSKVIKTIQKPVDKVVDPVINWLVKQGKKLYGKGKAGVKKLKDKVLSLLGFKKGFKGPDQKPHTLFMKQKGKSYQLTTASSPTRTEEYVTELAQKFAAPNSVNAVTPDDEDIPFKFAPTPTWKPANETGGKAVGPIFTKILVEVNIIRKQIKRWVLHTGDSKKTERANSPSKKQGFDFNTALIELSKHLQQLPAEPGKDLIRPTSDIDYKPAKNTKLHSSGSSDDGSKVDAKVLSSMPGDSAGSAANYPSKMYNNVNRRKEYVQGHLLHDKLYGAGNKKENITPITGIANGEMSRSIETQVQDMVFRNNLVVQYIITTDFGDQNVPANNTWPIPDERKVPKGLDFELYELEFKGNGDAEKKLPAKWGRKSTTNIAKQKRVDSTPTKVTTDINKQYVSTISEAKLKKAPYNVDVKFAQLIVSGRAGEVYKDEDDFRVKLNKSHTKTIMEPETAIKKLNGVKNQIDWPTFFTLGRDPMARELKSKGYGKGAVNMANYLNAYKSEFPSQSASVTADNIDDKFARFYPATTKASKSMVEDVYFRNDIPKLKRYMPAYQPGTTIDPNHEISDW